VIAFVFKFFFAMAISYGKLGIFLKKTKQQFQEKLRKLKANASRTRLIIFNVEADMTDSKFLGNCPVQEEFGAVRGILKEQELKLDYFQVEKSEIENRSVERPFVKPPGSTAPSTLIGETGERSMEFMGARTPQVTVHFQTEQATPEFISAAQWSGGKEVIQVTSPQTVETHETGSRVIKREKKVIVRTREIEEVKGGSCDEEEARVKKVAEYIEMFNETQTSAVEKEIFECLSKLCEQMASTNKRTEQLLEGFFKLRSQFPMSQTATLSKRKTGKTYNANRSPIICYFCRKEGHILRKCKAYRIARKNAIGGCSVGGRTGHCATDFREAQGQRADNGPLRGAPWTYSLKLED
jgi:hypothetical protein